MPIRLEGDGAAVSNYRIGETLPNVRHAITPDFVVVEASDRPEVYELVCGWHARRPGFELHTNFSVNDYLGPEWRNWLFFFDSVPRVCISIEERRPWGYEFNIASAHKTHPQQIRQAVLWAGDLLAQNPCRVISWVLNRNRAAMRLNKEFWDEEMRLTQNNEEWVRFATTTDEWWARRERHGR